MKKLILVALLFLGATTLIAQEAQFTKGDNVINLGLGLGSNYVSGASYSMNVPPVSGLYEIGVVDGIADKGVIGVGPYAGYFAYQWDYSGFDWGYKYTNLVFGARGNFHYPLISKLDTYVGVLLGYNIVSTSEFGSYSGPFSYDTSSGGVVYSGVVGARYYFSENLALMAEFGYGISYLTVGVSFKL